MLEVSYSLITVYYAAKLLPHIHTPHGRVFWGVAVIGAMQVFVLMNLAWQVRKMGSYENAEIASTKTGERQN
jgi:hypothetical protein